MSECPVIISSKTSSGVIPNIDEAISVPKIHHSELGKMKNKLGKVVLSWLRVAVGAFSRE